MAEVRLIDANALKILPDRFRNYHNVVSARGDGKVFQTMTLGVLAKVQEAINNAPTIDAVPVVRCRDCKLRGEYMFCPMVFQEWYYNDDGEEGTGFYLVDNTRDDGFCHMGAKMDAKEE